MLTKEEIQYKIDYEIIVDCYDEYEVSMGWYYFMEETLEFPFTAIAQVKKRDGSQDKQQVEITGLSSDEEGFIHQDFLLEMEIGGLLVPVAYSKLSDIQADASTIEAFEIWDYWVGKHQF